MHQTRSISPIEDVQGSRPPEKEFRPDIEGLRAVAVLAVVLFHADVPGVSGGYIGVDVFFVISGFLITGLLWRELTTAGTVRLRRFYGARARRLLPASAVVGVATAIGSALLLPPLQARSVLVDGIASALYVGNYRFVLELRNYFDAFLPPSPFQHYWSLGVEEQFYLVWPPMIIVAALLIRLGRRVLRRPKADAPSSTRPYLVLLAVVAASSFAMSLAITYVVPSLAFFSLPTRAWQLAAGGLVALTASRWRRLPTRPAAIVGWAGLSVVVLGCALLTTDTPYPGTAALLPVLGTALVIGAGCGGASQGCGRLLALFPMRAVGRMSYSWYLWHWPVLIFAPVLFGHPMGLVGRLAAVAVSALLAVLTLRLVENPLRFAPPLRRSPLRSLALGGVATAVSVLVAVALLVSIPVPIGRGGSATPVTIAAFPTSTHSDAGAYDAAVQFTSAQVKAAVAASVNLKAVPSNLVPPLADAEALRAAMFVKACMRAFFQAGQPECAAGDTASGTTVALVGDSNAAMWAPALQDIATQRRWRLEMLTRAGCPPMNVPLANPLRHLLYANCEQWRTNMLARLQAEHPRLVVLTMWRRYGGPGLGWQPGVTSYDAVWLENLTRLVRQLRETGAQVLVLGPVPEPRTAAPICLSAHLDDATACSAPRSVAVNDKGIEAEAAAVQAGAGRYADIADLFCTADRCPPIVGNTLVYCDTDHLTAEYPKLLAPVIAALADQAIAEAK